MPRHRRHHHRSFDERSADYAESRTYTHHRTEMSSDEPGSVVDIAERFTGTPYVYGGTSRSGFDCSGFTRYVLGESAGIELPRTALEQYENGYHISRAQLEPGDLVFFSNTYCRGISHVGIYIGNGNFVHAANEREGVTVSSLSEPYYAEHYAGARRVIFDREYTER